MSTLSNNDNRRSNRISLSLSAVVKAKESHDDLWKETTDLISISRSGAGFYLEKECRVGQLLSLLMPMPKHLRCYDHDKELYRVWGLVQHCSAVSGNADSSYHVGVAFIGKYSPPSYKENPLQSYRIAGMTEDGTWKIIESKASFIVRRHQRYRVLLDISLSALDTEDNFIADTSAVTDNISLSGVAVFSALNVDVGESVKFNCDKYDFSALTIVRHRQISGSDPTILHLEFIDVEFPMEMIKLSDQGSVLSNEVDNLSIKENVLSSEEPAVV